MRPLQTFSVTLDQDVHYLEVIPIHDPLPLKPIQHYLHSVVVSSSSSSLFLLLLLLLLYQDDAFLYYLTV